MPPKMFHVYVTSETFLDLMEYCSRVLHMIEDIKQTMSSRYAQHEKLRARKKLEISP
jgi:hypothetical protein